MLNGGALQNLNANKALKVVLINAQNHCLHKSFHVNGEVSSKYFKNFLTENFNENFIRKSKFLRFPRITFI